MFQAIRHKQSFSFAFTDIQKLLKFQSDLIISDVEVSDTESKRMYDYLK